MTERIRGISRGTRAGWTSFVDAWAQHHNVTMSENARDALINAHHNSFGEGNPFTDQRVEPNMSIVSAVYSSPVTPVPFPRERRRAPPAPAAPVEPIVARRSRRGTIK